MERRDMALNRRWWWSGTVAAIVVLATLAVLSTPGCSRSSADNGAEADRASASGSGSGEDSGHVRAVPGNADGNAQAHPRVITQARTPHIEALMDAGGWVEGFPAWERPIPNQLPPDGVKTLSAADCGECHKAIFAEWRTSIHAKAYVDPQFQAEWKKDGIYLCVNCHAPLQNQQPEIVVGLKDGNLRTPITEPNPDFDAALRDEGITCAVCHVREASVIGPSGDTIAPHPVAIDPEHLSARLCIRCHQADARVDAKLVCSLSTPVAWAAGPYAALGIDCIECHMPTVWRRNAHDTPPRASNIHTWVGAGIPKFAADPEPDRASYVSGMTIDARAELASDQPGAPADCSVTIMNARAGHEIPTGDVERFFLITMRVLDGDGTVLGERVERIGERWQWSPEIKQLEDTSLQPLERRTFGLTVALSDRLTVARFEVVVTNNRITEQNVRGMGLGDYPRGIEIYRRSIPLLGD